MRAKLVEKTVCQVSPRIVRGLFSGPYHKNKKGGKNLKDLEIMLSLAGTALGLLITVLTFVVKFIKSAKAKKFAEQTIEIGNAVLPFIKEAEKFTAFSGAEKKAYVMTKANQFALENGINFNETQVSEKIEELVTLTKQVNTKAASKEKTEATQELQTKTANSSWL